MSAAYFYNHKNGEYEVGTQREKVLALHLPANVVNFEYFKNGLCSDPIRAWGILQDILNSKSLYYYDRDEIENDENFLQLIPYVILKHKNRIFAYQRTKKSGEKRLHGNWSIGVGGHINPVDHTGDMNGAYWNAVFRELKEEVGANPEEIQLDSLIYDPSNAVGRVHLGVVHVATVNHTIRPIDDAMGAHGFFSWEELIKSNDISYENWTKLLLNSTKSY